MRRCGPRSGRRRSSAIGLGNELPTDALHNGVSEKVWFITGTSRGFGREWTIAALPLGGYVKMLDERESEGSIPEAELSQAFNRQSVFKRIAIVAAG